MDSNDLFDKIFDLVKDLSKCDDSEKKGYLVDDIINALHDFGDAAYQEGVDDGEEYYVNEKLDYVLDEEYSNGYEDAAYDILNRCDMTTVEEAIKILKEYDDDDEVVFSLSNHVLNLYDDIIKGE